MINEIQESKTDHKEKEIKKRGRKPKSKEIKINPPLIVIKEICYVEF
jgi:23S rRNA maturation mini-RNase III